MIKFNKIRELSMAMFEPDFSGPSFHLSFAIYKDRIIAITRNSVKTNPQNLLNPRIGRMGENLSLSKGTCSELALFIRLKKTTNIPFEKISIVNIRINRKRKFALSCPCDSCRNVLRVFPFKSVFYTNDEEEFMRYY